MIELLLIGGLVFALYETGQFAPFGFAPSAPAPSTLAEARQQQQQIINQNERGVAQPGAAPSLNVGGLALQGAASVGVGAVSGATALANTTIAGVSGAALGAITAGIGVVVTIFTVLWGRHEMRVKQAKAENTEVNVAVPGFDSDLQLVNQAYNSGQIDAATAIRALQQIYAQYWALVTPYIQPGRNGCQGGQNCGPMQQGLFAGKQTCVGDIGAACCIGCSPLYYSLYATGSEPLTVAQPAGPGAVTVLQSGGRGVSQIKTIGGSKYGARTRAGYTLRWGQA